MAQPMAFKADKGQSAGAQASETTAFKAKLAGIYLPEVRARGGVVLATTASTGAYQIATVSFTAMS